MVAKAQTEERTRNNLTLRRGPLTSLDSTSRQCAQQGTAFGGPAGCRGASVVWVSGCGPLRLARLPSALGGEMQAGKVGRGLSSFVHYTHVLLGILHKKQVFLKGSVLARKK